MANENIQEKLEKVRLSYISTLVDKRHNINTQWNSLKQNWEQESYDNMYMIIHGIAGSAETFGFPELTQSARSVIDYLKENKQDLPSAELIQTLENKIISLTGLMKTISES
jgi:HPt (histidine-containing phosphotransfer) domain-containing protein